MNSTAENPPSGLRLFFRRKWVSRGLFVIGCLATLIAIFYVVENWRGRRAWNQFVQTWEAKGEHFDPAAFIPPEVPDAENFAATPFLAPLFDFVPGTQQWRDTNAVERIKSFPPRYEAASRRLESERQPDRSSWAKPRTDLRAWYAAFYDTNATAASALEPMLSPGMTTPAEPAREGSALTNVPLEQAASGVLAALEEAEPVLEELRQASQRPYSRFKLRYEEENLMTILLPHLTPLRRLTMVLHLRGSANLALGREQAAFEDALLMLRLSEALRSEPLLISYLVRVAQVNATLSLIAEGLDGHQWTDAHLRVFQEQLGRLDLLADGKRALRAERAFSGSVIEAMGKSPKLLGTMGVYDGNPVPMTWQTMLARAIPTGWFYFERRNFCRLFQEYALPPIDPEQGRVDPKACERATTVLKDMFSRPPVAIILGHEAFTAMLLPALDKAIQRIALAQAGVDAAYLACGLERYRLAHGKYPESLSSLQPEFLLKMPQDVISGAPLKYHLKDGSFVLYSVGWNGTDEGGTIVYQKNRRSSDLTGGDWVWR